MRRALAVLVAAAALAAPPLRAQRVRATGWGAYEGVTGSQDWTTAGAQLTLTGARGHAVWLAGEVLGRFGETNVSGRAGITLHPAPRWWITLESGAAAEPTFVPKNTWEVDVTALATSRASVGLAYRRWNYVVGPVDIVIPHVTLQTRDVSLDARLYVSRNPSRRTDAAFTLRATLPVSARTAVSLLGGGGRESYLVGAEVRSLETLTGVVGVRHNAGGGFTLRADAIVIRSRPVLSRRGIAVGIAREL
ncbi:MAG: YaiO family outer membrane beta-barrel protein [Gemmatimonadales bacterium]